MVHVTTHTFHMQSDILKIHKHHSSVALARPGVQTSSNTIYRRQNYITNPDNLNNRSGKLANCIIINAQIGAVKWH